MSVFGGPTDEGIGFELEDHKDKKKHNDSAHRIFSNNS